MPHLRLGMDITMVVGEDTEDTMDGADTTDTPMDTDTVTWENALLMLNLKLMPKLPLRLMLMPLPGIMVDTTDTPTDTVTSENALLMLNLKLMPNPRLRPLPGTDTMVDTTVILIVAIMDMDAHTMVVTGGNLRVIIPCRLVKTCQLLFPL